LRETPRKKILSPAAGQPTDRKPLHYLDIP
jgi:hypothetical protein